MVTANYIRTLNIDEPLGRIKADGTVRYYQADALGAVIALTDETGAVRTQYLYDPFGNVTISGEASDNPFQYTGRENDGTGLYYYRARYYSPELQRFISEDPVRFGGGNNFYVYVGNNPVSFVDPLGLGPFECAKKVVGREVGKFPKAISDKYKHCVISCKIYLECGLISAVAAGIGKEIQDVFGPGTAEWADLAADYRGIQCGRKIKNQKENDCDKQTCESCCKSAYP